MCEIWYILSGVVLLDRFLIQQIKIIQQVRTNITAPATAVIHQILNPPIRGGKSLEATAVDTAFGVIPIR